MSDPSISDIDVNNKMALVWNTLKTKAKVGLLNKSNLSFLNGIIIMSMMHFIHICKMLFMYQLQPIQYATKSL